MVTSSKRNSVIESLETHVLEAARQAYNTDLPPFVADHDLGLARGLLRGQFEDRIHTEFQEVLARRKELIDLATRGVSEVIGYEQRPKGLESLLVKIDGYSHIGRVITDTTAARMIVQANLIPRTWFAEPIKILRRAGIPTDIIRRALPRAYGLKSSFENPEDIKSAWRPIFDKLAYEGKRPTTLAEFAESYRRVQLRDIEAARSSLMNIERFVIGERARLDNRNYSVVAQPPFRSLGYVTKSGISPITWNTTGLLEPDHIHREDGKRPRLILVDYLQFNSNIASWVIRSMVEQGNIVKKCKLGNEEYSEWDNGILKGVIQRGSNWLINVSSRDHEIDVLRLGLKAALQARQDKDVNVLEAGYIPYRIALENRLVPWTRRLQESISYHRILSSFTDLSGSLPQTSIEDHSMDRLKNYNGLHLLIGLPFIHSEAPIGRPENTGKVIIELQAHDPFGYVDSVMGSSAHSPYKDDKYKKIPRLISGGGADEVKGYVQYQVDQLRSIARVMREKGSGREEELVKRFTDVIENYYYDVTNHDYWEGSDHALWRDAVPELAKLPLEFIRGSSWWNLSERYQLALSMKGSFDVLEGLGKLDPVLGDHDSEMPSMRDYDAAAGKNIPSLLMNLAADAGKKIANDNESSELYFILSAALNYRNVRVAALTGPFEKSGISLRKAMRHRRKRDVVYDVLLPNKFRPRDMFMQYKEAIENNYDHISKLEINGKRIDPRLIPEIGISAQKMIGTMGYH